MSEKHRMELLQVKAVSKQRDERFAVKNITFSQSRLQRITIAGETGSGKTTLLKIIAGLEQASRGEVFFENKKVEGPEETLVAGHPSIAFLPQYFELPKFLRVEQVLSYASHVSAVEANRLFKLCQIETLLKRKTNELSGGERQRIALCRLLIGRPALLLLDEPFSNLDMALKSKLKTIIQDISTKLKITCLLVSHDPDDTLSWAEEIIVLKEGKVVQKGTPEEIYREPVSTYVAGLFGKFLRLSDQQQKSLGYRKRKIVRPEDFKFVKENRYSLGGTVQEIAFLGNSFEVKVLVGKTIVSIKSTRKLKINQPVFIGLKGRL
ncbi:MAG: ABC transporter ATP-binding protein [Flammeovirgaceae bacterium]|jgi:iron(III) transport system ATP-binding protein|nr:ABC transporter ATP-binding protein [Flammeovirgaceae bacterium]